MATKARQQYFADEVSLSKEKREFSIADEIQQKIDSIEEGAQVNKIETVKVNGTALVPDANKAVNIDVPEVIDNLYTVDSDNALSAKQGKLLYDYIQNIASRGRFLSNWNSATGLPMTNPSENPYPYKSGDYFIVSNVAGLGGTNYRPDGSSYIIGQASIVVETNSVDVSDFYFYDGTNWLLLKNSGRSGAVDSALSTTSTNPVENRVITNALNGKQETLIAGNNIQIAADGKTISATDTTYSAGANISIDANNEISATDTTYTAGTNVQISNQNVISATDTKYTAGTGINIDANNVISNTQTSAEWGNITGTLSDQTDLQTVLNAKQDNMVILKYGISTWNDFITAYNKNGVIYCRASSNSNPASGSQTRLAFMAYVNNETAPTEVEFQYYRSRSSHSTAATVLDEVYVYKLVSTGGGTWSVTQRDTAAKPLAGTGIGLTYNASGMTISADTTTLATKTDLNSKANATDVNTKTFYLSNLSDLTTAQAAYDWYVSGKNPIIVYRTTRYNIVSSSSTLLLFVYNNTSILSQAKVTSLRSGAVKFTISNGSVTGITVDSYTDNILKTDYDYQVPYTPQYNGSPATKKYVDDSVSSAISAGTTAPSSPAEGQLWYDTTNDQLKVYDGTNWNVTGKEYTAGNGISIGNLSISSRQGPCEEGFHVPSAADWQGVETIMNGLGFSDGADWDTKLHLPKAGYRRYSDGEKVVGYSVATGVYWSTSRDSDTYSYKVFTLAFDSSNVGTRESECRAIAASIRPFKNAYVAPDATWTVIYGTLGSAGIFWNQTEGLISITDGTNGYTMADKNLGATTVYSSGNTLSEANCGYLYQWGNNYAFPWSGSVTTSSTLVNASSYGPGNYYSSSTFITVSSNPRDWSSVQNNDLWGDTTNTTTNINNAISNTGVLSVNGQTGDISIETFQLAPNSPLTPKYRRYGSQAQYDALTQYYTDNPGDTVYFTI